jgi:FkbM family methyltransferase
VESTAKIRNVTLLNVGLYDEVQKVKFKNSIWGSSHICEKNDFIDGSLDFEDKLVIKGDILNLEPTFIKMDIEGAEFKALRGLEKTIKANHPKLAICAYHKPADLWMIPLYIKEFGVNYKFFLRHHSYTDSETVCYAI